MESDRQVRGLEDFVLTGAHRQGIYGVQWGDPEIHPHVQEVRDGWLRAALPLTGVAMEIGSGGGRWSRYFAGECWHAYLVDGTPASEIAVRQVVDWAGFEFLISKDGLLPTVGHRSVDYVFSFDVFVHFDRPLFDTYLREVGRILKPGGRLHLHYAHAWPGLEHNAECFKYREEADVGAVLREAGLALTTRRLDFPCGFGSVLREAVKLL